MPNIQIVITNSLQHNTWFLLFADIGPMMRFRTVFPMGLRTIQRAKHTWNSMNSLMQFEDPLNICFGRSAQPILLVKLLDKSAEFNQALSAELWRHLKIIRKGESRNTITKSLQCQHHPCFTGSNTLAKTIILIAKEPDVIRKRQSPMLDQILGDLVLSGLRGRQKIELYR